MNAPDDLPEGTISIEIRGIYDGVSAYLMPTGEYVNRWPQGDRRHAPTQDWIDRNTKSETR